MTLLERKSEVPSEFDGVARHYDLMTALNPGYRKHLRWSARRIGATDGCRILDLCCGTGLSTDALLHAYPTARIDAVDASRGMLDAARKKPMAQRVNFILGNAMDLPGCGIDGPYDAVLMAYGIRNMPDPDTCLRGLAAVLAPNARLCFHEYSVADSRLSRTVWNLVTNAIVIPAGLMTSPQADIYRYLRRSVLDFDGKKAFEARLRTAGFEAVHTLPMDGWQRGIVHSFMARWPNGVA